MDTFLALNGPVSAGLALLAAAVLVMSYPAPLKAEATSYIVRVSRGA